MQAMILAAGFGTRLRPYTLCRPKPLFPILNVPLLHILLDKLAACGCTRIVVNGHHLADQIEAALVDRQGVHFQHEPEILGTGGSLRKALPLFADEPVLVMNGDIYHDIDLAQLLDWHRAGGDAVSMAMHDYDRFNSVLVRDERISSFAAEEQSVDGELLAFTGIHILNPEVIARIPDNGFFHIIDLYTELARTGQVASVRVDNSFWRDIGTVADYLGLHKQLLAQQQMLSSESTTAGWCIDPAATIGDNVRLADWGSIGAHAEIGDNCSLTRCVVWDRVRIAAGQELTDRVLCQYVTG